MEYASLEKDDKNLLQVDSGKKGGNFQNFHWCIMGFKGWLRGMHHQVDMQAYIDEYCFWLTFSNMKDGIFENVLNRMVKVHPSRINQLLLKSLIQKNN